MKDTGEFDKKFDFFLSSIISSQVHARLDHSGGEAMPKG
jgi:hypothetical protein